MYLKHFAMTHFPFDNTLDATSLFDAKAQAEAERCTPVCIALSMYR